MASSFIVVAGNIGAGKSTLVGLLSQRLGLRPWYEPVTENPYLIDFYADMPRWAFASQAWFLGSRAATHRELAGFAGPVVQDRSLYEDCEIFARNLLGQGVLSQRDWQTYRALYEVLAAALPAPDLVIYLRAPLTVLRKRIQQRGRDFEQSIPDAYLLGLQALYEAWIPGFTLSPVLTVEAAENDFIAGSGDLDRLVTQVKPYVDRSQGLLF